jgi:pyruvate dehydrogenase E1 component alpha subunit
MKIAQSTRQIAQGAGRLNGPDIIDRLNEISQIAHARREKVMAPNNQMRLWMYERMVRHRLFEEQIILAYFEGKRPAFDMKAGPLPGEMHFSYGQEPVAVGVCANLGPEDVVTTAHRPHHVAVARDVGLKRLAAEVFQRRDGLNGGRGGHMHLYDPTVNFSCSSIVGESMGPTAGIALSRKLRNKPGVAVTIIGEGATNQGAWHEVMNMASLWKLPFICVVEDNYYGVTVSKKESTSIARNSDRASAYGCFGEYVEGNDADLIYAATERAVARARAGEGPTILEVQTARLKGHYAGDQNAYVPQDIKDKYFQDALPVYRERLLEQGVAGKEELQALETQLKSEVDDAIRFGRESAPPDAATALLRVFA